MDNEAENVRPSERELVAFRVSGQDYCVDIMSVREIRGWTEVTSLPHAPSYVRGVINLRGSVVPIVDLSARLGLEPIAASSRNVIIITIVHEQIVGLLVEAVFDIVSVPTASIQETPEVASDTVRTFVEGVVSVEENMIRLIDLSHILPSRIKDAA